MSYYDFDDGNEDYDYEDGYGDGYASPLDSISEAVKPICPALQKMPFGLCNLPLLIGGALFIFLGIK